MKKRPLILSLAVLAFAAIAWFMLGSGKSKSADLTVVVKKSEFVSTVVSSGELRAKNSTRIRGPREVRNYRISEMKIADLIPEGTVVKKGEYVGKLDPSEISNTEKDLLNELDKTESQFIQAQLDTALELRAKRDEIKNLKFAVEEREIEVSYSEYEPPATQRQSQLNLEKAKRAYVNALESYQLKKRQSVAKVREVGVSLTIQKNNVQNLRDLMAKFVITAPQDGMVIYAREWNGKKKTVGSTIRSWDPTIAELPDMSVMISRTSVNEVDISKVKEDQEVEIGIDAFPDKKYKGKVTYVANVGENNQGASGKTFEVTIQLNQTDSILRPGMTTSNHITVFTEPDVLSVPIECVYATDSLSYVIKKSGIGVVKQEVKVGKNNAIDIIILEGVEEGEELYLSPPADMHEKTITRLKENS